MFSIACAVSQPVVDLAGAVELRGVFSDIDDARRRGRPEAYAALVGTRAS
jgi:hypothetical protein